MERSGVLTCTETTTSPQCVGHGEQRAVEVHVAIAREQRARFVNGRGLTEKEHDLLARAGRHLDHGLERGARVEAGPDRSGRAAPPLQERGMIECPVAAQDLRPVPGPRGLASAQIGERDAVAEVDVPDVARQHRPRVPIDLGDDERGGGASRVPSVHSK